MNLVKIGEVFHVRFNTGKGKRRKTVSTGSTNLADAKKIVADARIKEIELAAQAGVLQSAVIQTIQHDNQKNTIKGIVLEYLDWMRSVNKAPSVIKNAEDNLGAWLRHGKIQQVAPRDVTEAQISSYINRDGSTKASSRMVQLSCISSFYNWMSAKSYVTGNLAHLVKVDFSKLSHEQKEPKKREPFTDDEYLLLLMEADKGDDDFWKFAIRIGRMTGLRLGDIAAMEWESLSKPGFIVVWMGKTDTRLELPLTDDMAMLVMDLPADDDKYIFPTQRLIAQDPDCRANLSVQFLRLCAKAGIAKGKSFHNLRHAKATEVFNQTGDMEAVQAALGHADAKTSETYVH